VSAHKGFKGSFISASDEALQQLTIRHLDAILSEDSDPKMAEEATQVVGGHILCSVTEGSPHIKYRGNRDVRAAFFIFCE
jgi:hypothetical protein